MGHAFFVLHPNDDSVADFSILRGQGQAVASCGASLYWEWKNNTRK